MKKFISILLFILVVLLIAQPVSAHILKTNGTIGAILHVEPEDDPIAGQPSSIHLEFKDKASQLDSQEGTFKTQIYLSGKKIYDQDLLFGKDGNTEYGHIDFNFPQKGIYTIVVTGNPKTPTTFQPFSLNYDVRVAKELVHQNQPNNQNNIPIIITFVILVILLIAFFKNRRQGLKILAILVLVFFAQAHFAPTKLAFSHDHQSHSSSHNHPCCLPQVFTTIIPLEISSTNEKVEILKLVPILIPVNLGVNPVHIRSPPQSS